MAPRCTPLGNRWPPVLVLPMALLLGCPQLLSDEFSADGSYQGGGLPHLVDANRGARDAGTGAAGSSGSVQPSSPWPSDPGNVLDGGGDPELADDETVVAPAESGSPSVVKVTPPNGATGVAADATIALEFSEPMDTAAVEAAYTSSSLPASRVSFSWSAGNTLLRITPNQLLTLATGSNPATAPATRYSFEISSAARDLQGHALPRLSSSFSTLREITSTLSALQDRTLTGNWRSDDVFGSNDCAESGTVTCVGDSSNGNSTYRGFVSFDLSSLPAALVALSSAQLRLTVDSILSAPFASLGTLGVEHVSFEAINLTAFGAVPIHSFIGISSAAAQGAQLSADVLTAAREDVATRDRSQYRLRFTVDSDSDGDADMVELQWNTERLVLTYLLP